MIHNCLYTKPAPDQLDCILQMSVYNLPFFTQIDSLAGMASLSLGGSAAPHTQSMQGFPPNLGSAFSTPQSPAKAFPPLSTQNQTTGFSGIGGLSSQLPGTVNWVEWFGFDLSELRRCYCCGWKCWENNCVWHGSESVLAPGSPLRSASEWCDCRG